MANCTEDTLSFIRRSLHDLLKDKNAKAQILAKLNTPQTTIGHEQQMQSYEYVDNNVYITHPIADHERVIPGINVRVVILY